MFPNEWLILDSRVTDPEAIDWNNLDRVEKQEMDEETYDTFKPTSVKPTVREYKVKWFNLGEIQWFLGFQGPPTPANQRLCGFDKGRSLVVK